MTIVISLILIFIGNSLPLNGILMGVVLPFISFIIGKRRSPFFIFLAWILYSLQTDKYSYNFLILILFSIVNFFLFHYVEYNKKSILYLVPLDVAFYMLVVFKSVINNEIVALVNIAFKKLKIFSPVFRKNDNGKNNKNFA